jgi:hypothetical protein
MTRIRLALAIALLMISGPTLAAAVLASSVSIYGSLSYCIGQFESTYIEDLSDAEWINGTAGMRACDGFAQ